MNTQNNPTPMTTDLPAARLLEQAAVKLTNNGALRVLVMIATRMDERGECFLRQREIGTLLKMRRQVVNRHFRALRENGLVKFIDCGLGLPKGYALPD
jgi:DNA-binding MarR family transcriptional regulator